MKKREEKRKCISPSARKIWNFFVTSKFPRDPQPLVQPRAFSLYKTQISSWTARKTLFLPPSLTIVFGSQCGQCSAKNFVVSLLHPRWVEYFPRFRLELELYYADSSVCGTCEKYHDESTNAACKQGEKSWAVCTVARGGCTFRGRKIWAVLPWHERDMMNVIFG